MEEPGSSLADRKVLVTGATGFIGSALAERLASTCGATVTGTGRRLAAVQHLVSHGVSLRASDLTDRDSVRDTLADQEVVFHVAAWLPRATPDADRARQINVTAVDHLVRDAKAAGAERFVLVSSVAAYGSPHQDRVTEDHPLGFDQPDLYGATKAEGERVAREAADEVDLDLTIVRPAMVYGPRSAGWTVQMIELLQKGLPTLFGTARGTAFPIYIDNQIDALLLAATAEQAIGEAYHFSDGALTWEEWFTRWGEIAARRPRRVPWFLARGIAWASERLPLGIPLTPYHLELYERPLEFPTDKARDQLGWEPRVDLEEGFRRSGAWAREVGLVGERAP